MITAEYPIYEQQRPMLSSLCSSSLKKANQSLVSKLIIYYLFFSENVSNSSHLGYTYFLEMGLPSLPTSNSITS